MPHFVPLSTLGVFLLIKCIGLGLSSGVTTAFQLWKGGKRYTQSRLASYHEVEGHNDCVLQNKEAAEFNDSLPWDHTDINSLRNLSRLKRWYEDYHVTRIDAEYGEAFSKTVQWEIRHVNNAYDSRLTPLSSVNRCTPSGANETQL